MKSTSVDSTVILSVAHDEQKNLLRIRYRNGRVYYYVDVPRETYRDFLAAPSAGKYLNEVIKPNYRAVRVRAKRKGVRRGKPST